MQHIDGYLCEVKDIQIKDGLHVLGQAPQGEQLRGLTAAMLRLGSGDVQGLRRAVGAAFGLDEPALVAAPGTPVTEGATDAGAAMTVPAGLIERFHGPAASAGDLVDRLEAAQMALLDALAASDWDADAVAQICEEVLGRSDAGVERALRFAAREVVPRIRRTDEELEHVLAALHGRHVPAGPSGQPHARAPRRAAHGAQLLLGRSAIAAVGAVLGSGAAPGGRAAGAPPPRDGRAAADGRTGGVGHIGDAHAGR